MTSKYFSRGLPNNEKESSVAGSTRIESRMETKLETREELDAINKIRISTRFTKVMRPDRIQNSGREIPLTTLLLNIPN